mmetsp:Transcript_19696/g.52245  ORF Transcript_19696/g.52245 Transcript_19696/m.52245 type:complete len:274 (-) Transcript_19696:651-1472(-)
MAVASLTDASSALMLFSVSAISSASAAMFSSALAIAVSVSAATCSSSFFLSSVESNVDRQYSFLSASSSPSFFKAPTISSIMEMTFSKPIFLPRRASTRKPRRACLGFAWRARCRRATARDRRSALCTFTCSRLALGAGSVFLKSSRASSSFKILIVSARARSSSLRVFTRASYSASFVEHPAFRSASSFLSSRRLPAASSRSAFICTMDTPSSPTRASFCSMEAVSTPISFFFAATSASCSLTAAASASSAAFSDFMKSSPICFSIPVTSPL